jgi:hypothetical protein
VLKCTGAGAGADAHVGVQRRCKGGAEVQMCRCAGDGAEVQVQRCRDAEGQRYREYREFRGTEVQRCKYTGAGVMLAQMWRCGVLKRCRGGAEEVQRCRSGGTEEVQMCRLQRYRGADTEGLKC